MLEFNNLSKVHEKSKKAGVGFSLVFCESDDSFYFCVNSAAPAEEWIGKSKSLMFAINDVSTWLDSLV